MRNRMLNGWRAGQPETVCGNGSTLAATANIRHWLPVIADRYLLRVICDAGAGDLHWIRRVSWPHVVDYRPFDLVPRLKQVSRLDITTEQLPKCDAILCRMVLNHLVDVVNEGRDESRIDMALELFAKSGQYLIATHFDGPQPQRAPQFARLDLVKRLGRPLDSVQDGNESACRLALWKL